MRKISTVLLCLVVFCGAYYFLTLSLDLPLRYGIRIRLGEDRCEVVEDIWKDYHAGELETHIGLFRASSRLCPSNSDVRAITEDLNLSLTEGIAEHKTDEAKTVGK